MTELLALMALTLQTIATPAEIADLAVNLQNEGRYEEAYGLLLQLHERMPHSGRIAYGLASAAFLLDRFAESHELLADVSGDIGVDTLETARVLSRLALSIQMEDYAGVENAVEALRGNVSRGLSPECERIGLEAGLNWLDNHEPPEEQDESTGEQDEEPDEPEDSGEDPEENGEEEPDDGSNDADTPPREEGPEEEDEGRQPQPPPAIDEMSAEQARSILDLVEEDLESPDPAAGKAGHPSGPTW